MDWGQLGSFIRGTFQARMLEWVAISWSRASSWPRDWIRMSFSPRVSCVGRQILSHCTTWDDPADNSDAICQVIVLSFCIRLFLCKQLHYVDPGHPNCLPKYLSFIYPQSRRVDKSVALLYTWIVDTVIYLNCMSNCEMLFTAGKIHVATWITLIWCLKNSEKSKLLMNTVWNLAC